jgi:hypothetical protein
MDSRDSRGVAKTFHATGTRKVVSVRHLELRSTLLDETVVLSFRKFILLQLEFCIVPFSFEIRHNGP